MKTQPFKLISWFEHAMAVKITLMLFTLFGASLACGLNQSTPAAPSTAPEQIEAGSTTPPLETNQITQMEWKDLAYATDSSAQKLDIYIPSEGGPFPTIIYVHGGGFRMGDKKLPLTRGIVEKLTANGYAVASLNYRLSGEAQFPAQIQDVKSAVRWLREHALEYHLDAERFGAWGDSAGANLASLLGTSCGAPELEADPANPDDLNCVSVVVDFYGPIDFLQMDAQYQGTACPATHNRPNSAESEYVGGPIQKLKDVVRQANPITYISADDPAFFIQHGSLDCTVPPQQSQLFYDALKPVIGENNVSFTILEGADHGDDQFYTSSNLDLVVDFLNQHLK